MAPTLFIDSQGKQTSLQPGSIIPAIIRPLDQNPSYTYNYYNPSKKQTYSLPPSTYVVTGMVFTGSAKVVATATPVKEGYSNGETWAPSAGAQGVIIPVGGAVPPGWIAVSGVISYENVKGLGLTQVDTGNAHTTDIPVGYTAYTTPNSGVIVVPSDQSVPADWVASTIPNATAEIYQNDANGVEIVNNADPNAFADPLIDLQFQPAPPANYFWKILGAVVGIAGAAGIGYVGWLAYQDPQKAARIIENAAKGAGFIITIVQAAAAVAILGALSFVSWEFWKAMDENDGNVAKAIGSMLASAIEIFVLAIVDAVEQLAKDAWTFIITEIKSILPSWL